MTNIRAPKNRLPTARGVLDLQIAWEGGELSIDPNGLITHAVYGDYPVGLPFKETKSLISGKPSYLFRCDNIEIPLTLDEMDRLFRYDLKPSEFKKLLDHFGRFFHVIDDFYDHSTGEAMQPKPKGTQFGQTKARILAVQESIELSTVAQPTTQSKTRSSI